ncbi:unnamed protein product [Durusdinium trenchii]|uniref:Uncharacterized protein n=2 Tax=Durusdinium trenchii TaxID=1381693 RepID=A0ABP0MYV4_9DINO
MKGHGSYGYTPVGKPSLQKMVGDSHKQSMCVLAIGLILIFMMLILGFCYVWYSSVIPRQCPTGLPFYFWLNGISNLALAVLLAIGLYLMKGMMLSVSHQMLAQGMHDHAQAYAIAGGHHSTSVAAHRSEFQESALHYGGGMTAVLVLQSLVMLFQLGLGIYGCYEAVKIQREGNSYICGNAIPVFWTLFSLHLIQNCCNLGKFQKGRLEHKTFASSFSFFFVSTSDGLQPANYIRT